MCLSSLSIPGVWEGDLGLEKRWKVQGRRAGKSAGETTGRIYTEMHSSDKLLLESWGQAHPNTTTPISAMLWASWKSDGTAPVPILPLSVGLSPSLCG